jgi:hypothetical protein
MADPATPVPTTMISKRRFIPVLSPRAALTPQACRSGDAASWDNT